VAADRLKPADTPGRAARAELSDSELFQEACRVMPGGVNSPVRAMRQIDREPVFIESGHGCHLTGRDGREYVDWVCSWGPMILGHADPVVVDAVSAAASRGLGFGAATAAEVELAELIVERMPSVGMVRLTSSGTEAAMGAVRLARAITGRNGLVKFSGAYHGHSDSLLVEAGSGVATLAVPGSPGIPESVVAHTHVVPWNDPEAVASALAGDDVAALMVEPVPANMGVVPPEEGLLVYLRELCDRHGTLLVFDEVITGFRVAPGGAQELYGVEPDLTVMGKILGGGLPAAAIGGPERHLARLAPAGDVYQAGTLSGNPVAVAAGLATLRQLDDQAYLRLGELSDRLASGLATLTRRHGLRVQSVPGLVTLFFCSGPVRNFDDALATDAEAHARFCRGMLDRGVYLPPSRFEAWFVSLAHDEAAVDFTLAAAEETLNEIAAGEGRAR
jgi:glutamate-1-semialdehyde 2,1-aminomutase